jgi:hypothetical protein
MSLSPSISTTPITRSPVIEIDKENRSLGPDTRLRYGYPRLIGYIPSTTMRRLYCIGIAPTLLYPIWH